MKNPNDPASGAPVGARSDDSSLFSLDSLKRSEQNAAGKKTTEDSGLIDLKALALLEKDKPAASHVPDLIGTPDLFQISAPIAPIAAPHLAAVAAAPAGYEAPRPKSKLPLVIGAVVGVIAIGAGVFMLGRSSTGEARPAMTPTSTATATTQATAAAPADTGASDEPKVAAVTPGQRQVKEEAPKVEPTATVTAAPKPVGVAPRGAVKAQPKKEEAPAPPPKPVETCDLACQMQRAVNKKK